MKIAKNAAKTALLATAALAMAYAVTPSPLTAVAATAMVQNRAFHESMQTECHWRRFYPRRYQFFVCLNTPNKPNQKFLRTFSTTSGRGGQPRMGWRKLTVRDRDDGSGALRRGSATHHLRGPASLEDCFDAAASSLVGRVRRPQSVRACGVRLCSDRRA